VDIELLITVVILAISFVANIVLGGIVLLHNTKNVLNQVFFTITISAALWVLTNLLFVVTSGDVQYMMALASYGAAAIVALCFLLYCLELKHVRRSSIGYGCIIGIGLLAAVLSIQPGAIASGVTADSRLITNSTALSVYGLYLFAYFVSGIIVLALARHQARYAEKAKVTIVLAGLGAAVILGMFFNLILPMLGDYDFVKLGPVSTLIFVGTSAYAIVRHQLFDIKLAAIRSIVYIGALVTLSAIYYLLAYLFSQFIFGEHTTNSVSVSPINIVLALLLAFLFQPIKRFFDRTTDRIFYRDTYKSDDFFERFGDLLVSTTDLRTILERASTEIASTLKASQGFFMVYYGDDRYMSAGTKRHGRLPIDDARALDKYFEGQGRDAVLSEFLSDDESVRRLLVSHKIDIIMPLRRGGDIIGYLCLGQNQRSGYTKRDIRTLETVTNELVIAIQNALSVQEVKEINATLQQRIDVATKELRSSNSQLRHIDEVKDEFISMASHQLRTPLTSVKGYISMVLEGDVGAVSSQQKQLLGEAFNSSERMVRLISDFLNVSRLQTGKFMIEKTPTDLAKLVEQEVESLRVIASTHGLKLSYRQPKTFPTIPLDEGKMRQVVMNFIDNAIYYSKENSTVMIELAIEGDGVKFTVKDTGIGVPEAEQARLFHKFFRATNARKQRPDGTGVGLFLAKRVISEHSGKMIFSSVEGQGSTFGFYIPTNQK
jgi:signal transduction histidine kinase